MRDAVISLKYLESVNNGKHKAQGHACQHDRRDGTRGDHCRLGLARRNQRMRARRRRRKMSARSKKKQPRRHAPERERVHASGELACVYKHSSQGREGRGQVPDSQRATIRCAEAMHHFFSFRNGVRSLRWRTTEPAPTRADIPDRATT